LTTEEASTPQEFYTVEVSAELSERHRSLFALKVKGAGMIDALIDNGDVVIIRPAAHVKNGEMVIAWFKDEEESILRKFYAEGDQVRLQPANSTMDPIYSAKGNIEVRGKIVCVIRNLDS
jgi:repressor LexA